MPPVPDFTGTYTLGGAFPRVCMRRALLLRERTCGPKIDVIVIVRAKIGPLSAELNCVSALPCTALQTYISAGTGADLPLRFHEI